MPYDIAFTALWQAALNAASIVSILLLSSLLMRTACSIVSALLMMALTACAAESTSTTPSPTLVPPTPDPREESIEATRARCANEPLEQGRILFTRAFTDTDGRLKYDLFYIDVRTQALERALKTPTPMDLPFLGVTAQGLPLPGRVGGSLSPDGKRIAYFDMRRVVVANADGSDPQVVDTSLARLSDAIQWSPNGTRIAYVDYISKTVRVAMLVPKLRIFDEKADVPILSISSYTWPPDESYGRRLYSAGCIVPDEQCPFISVAYLSRPQPELPPYKVGTNAIYPRWSPVSNLIAAQWFSPENPQFLEVGVIEKPNGVPWKPAEALVSGGLSWSPNGCALVAPALNKQGLFLFDLGRQSVRLLLVPDSAQVLHPQWVQ